MVELADEQQRAVAPSTSESRPWAVVERVGPLAPLRAAVTAVTQLVVVDADGRKLGSIPTRRAGATSRSRI